MSQAVVNFLHKYWGWNNIVQDKIWILFESTSHQLTFTSSETHNTPRTAAAGTLVGYEKREERSNTFLSLSTTPYHTNTRSTARNLPLLSNSTVLCCWFSSSKVLYSAAVPRAALPAVITLDRRGSGRNAAAAAASDVAAAAESSMPIRVRSLCPTQLQCNGALQNSYERLLMRKLRHTSLWD